MSPLISVNELKELLQKTDADKKLHIIDVRSNLQDGSAGLKAYKDGHIPGAVYFDVNTDLSATPTGTNGRHPLPERNDFSALLASRGMQVNDHYVVYDAADSMFASRLWWMLRWVGCANSQVLNGGLKAWQTASGELETTEHAFGDAVEWQESPRLVGGKVNIDEVEVNIRLHDFLVVDARSASRFRGEGDTMDSRSGHIPGAVNRPFAESIDAEGFFKSPETLREEFSTLFGVRPSSEVIAQCGSGISACHTLLAMEVAGLKGAKLYAGSWSEWSSDPNRPIETGD